MALLSWLRRPKEPRTDAMHRLRSAERIVALYRQGGADRGAALRKTLDQVRGLRQEVESDPRWAALVELARRIGDPWNADDWPLGFDPLLICVPLCTDVDYECARCPIGQRQEGRSCAHPLSHFGRLGHLVRAAKRSALLGHLEHLERTLVELQSSRDDVNGPT